MYVSQTYASLVTVAPLPLPRDMTGARVFSIDPPTARDLDDALSIRALSYREAEDLTKSRR